MKHAGWNKHLGTALVFIGAVLLLVSYPTGLSHFNAVLWLALACVVGGTVLQVWMQKRGEKY